MFVLCRFGGAPCGATSRRSWGGVPCGTTSIRGSNPAVRHDGLDFLGYVVYRLEGNFNDVSCCFALFLSVVLMVLERCPEVMMLKSAELREVFCYLSRR